MLKDYEKKRQFHLTPEPKSSVKLKNKAKRPFFVVQKHRAQNLHYDFRLEIDKVLKSWAVPKSIPLKKNDKKLAIETENHPLSYAEFEGKIPEGLYGAGTVQIWDKGRYKIIKGAVEKGHLQINILGDKLKGTYNLVQFKQEKDKKFWLLFKS